MAALRFRMLLVGIAAGLIALGILALPNMHADVLPELSQGPVLEVQTESPGLSSQEVEQYITVPMENNLLDGVMGVWDVRSQSTPGLSTRRSVLRARGEHAARAPARRGAADELVLAAGGEQAAAADPAAVLDQPRADDRAERPERDEPARALLSRPVGRQAAPSGRSGSRERRDLRPAGPADPGPGRPREARGEAHHAAADHRHRRATRSSFRRSPTSRARRRGPAASSTGPTNGSRSARCCRSERRRTSRPCRSPTRPASRPSAASPPSSRATSR